MIERRKRWRTWAILGVMCLGLAGCATRPTASQIATADYGSRPGPEHQQLIKDWFAERLIDPTSPLYTFREPVKGYIGKSPLYGTEMTFGWVVCGTVNAKNRMGGYTGREIFFTIFNNGKLKFAISGITAEELCGRARV